MVKPKVNILKKKKRYIGHPTERIKEVIYENPNLEHMFVKALSSDVENVSLNSRKNQVTRDNKKLIEYYSRTRHTKYSSIHTHNKSYDLAMLPSIQDLLSILKSPESKKIHTIYVHQGKNVEGSVHYYVKNPKLLTDIEESYNLFKVLFSNEATLKSKLENNTSVNAFIQSRAFYDVCLKNKNCEKYLDDLLTQFSAKLSSKGETVEFGKFDFFNNVLLQNKRALLKIYKLLDVKVRFVPNKKDGYSFDSKKIDFIRN
jgi:hypothetical protein